MFHRLNRLAIIVFLNAACDKVGQTIYKLEREREREREKERQTMCMDDKVIVVESFSNY